MSLFQSNLRKQIRKLPKILKSDSVIIILYRSLLFIRVHNPDRCCADHQELRCLRFGGPQGSRPARPAWPGCQRGPARSSRAASRDPTCPLHVYLRGSMWRVFIFQAAYLSGKPYYQLIFYIVLLYDILFLMLPPNTISV